MFGFETKMDEIINFHGRNRFDDLDVFLAEIQANHTRDNISYFTILENTKNIEEIKQKITYSFLKDYFMFGELIALDRIGCMVFSRIIYESEQEFEQSTSIKKMENIENLARSLNLLDLYNLYMPKLFYDDKKCKLDGNYNVFLVKVLRRIKNLD